MEFQTFYSTNFYSANDSWFNEISETGSGRIYVRIPDVPAMFPGGVGQWQEYLARNLDKDAALNNSAPVGDYTVIVSFEVDKEGNISEVKPLKDPGYGTAEEAIRVIKNGPAWIPAVQNRKNVVYRQKQSMTFSVYETIVTVPHQ